MSARPLRSWRQPFEVLRACEGQQGFGTITTGDEFKSPGSVRQSPGSVRQTSQARRMTVPLQPDCRCLPSQRATRARCIGISADCGVHGEDVHFCLPLGNHALRCGLETDELVLSSVDGAECYASVGSEDGPRAESRGETPAPRPKARPRRWCRVTRSGRTVASDRGSAQSLMTPTRNRITTTMTMTPMIPTPPLLVFIPIS
jgi:hypothetical protein